MEEFRKLPTREEILEFYDFDHETGKFYHKHNTGRGRKGEEAGTRSGAYVKISIRGRQIYAHRLVPVMIYGIVPPGIIIDHMNQDGFSNAPDNLRFADRRLNGMNSKVRKNNVTGVRGVSFNRRRNQFEAYIAGEKFKKKSLGWFKDLASAAAARREAELRYGVIAEAA